MDVRGSSNIGDAGAMALASALQTDNHMTLTSLNLFGAAVCALWRIVLMCYILTVWLAQANQQLKKRSFLLDCEKKILKKQRPSISFIQFMVPTPARGDGARAPNRPGSCH
jgi:hypothetical protein